MKGLIGVATELGIGPGTGCDEGIGLGAPEGAVFGILEGLVVGVLETELELGVGVAAKMRDPAIEVASVSEIKKSEIFLINIGMHAPKR